MNQPPDHQHRHSPPPTPSRKAAVRQHLEEGACPFGRITRRHGVEAIAAYAAEELTAEHAALMDRARRHQDAYFVRLADLAQRAADWADKVRAAAHADAVHVQADRARARITR